MKTIISRICIIFLCFFILTSLVNIEGVGAVTYSYTYDVTLGEYVIYPGVLPGYYTTNVKGREVKLKTATITISVKGFPSDFSTTLQVDGKATGSIPGGGIAKFEIKGDEVHTFQVDTYVEGISGERFYCSGNSWTSEKGKEVEVEKYRQTYIYQPYYYYDWWWGYEYWYYYHPYYQKYTETIIEPFDQSYTFTYEAEYELNVQNKHGSSVQHSGWHKKDSTITLDTSPMIDVSQGEREVFESWNVDGTAVKDNQFIVKMDRPHEAIAKYKRQFYIDVRSEKGYPQGSGWYDENSQTTISIEEELPQRGFIGSIGGKYVFDGWAGDENAGSPTLTVTVDKPKIIMAKWVEDNSMPIIILIVIIIIILAAILVSMRGRLTKAPREERKIPERERALPEHAIFCYQCSAKISKTTKFCPECGADQKR